MTTDWQMKRRKLDELLTIDKLTGWLGKQDPGGEYTWQDPAFCLMGRYLADNESGWGEFAYSELPGYREIAEAKPWNFGAALERARAYQALPAPSQAQEPLQIEATEEKELDYEPATPGSLRLSAPERHAATGDGSSADGS